MRYRLGGFGHAAITGIKRQQPGIGFPQGTQNEPFSLYHRLIWNLVEYHAFPSS